MAAAPNHAASDKHEHSSLDNDSSGGLVTRVDLEPGFEKKAAPSLNQLLEGTAQNFPNSEVPAR